MESEDNIDEFDAVFVGSGFGAAVTARRLVSCFEKSILLERGRRYEPQDFPRVKFPEYLTDQPELQTSQRLPDAARLMWAFDQGLFDVRNLGQLRVVQAAGFGGGSLIYANVQLRPPASVFEAWPKVYRAAELDPYFDRVMDVLGARPWPADRVDGVPKAALMRKAARQLDRDKKAANGGLTNFFYPPLAIDAGKCTGCGNCTIGCQEGAKNTLDKNYLEQAKLEGGDKLQIRTLCEVMWIENGASEPYHVIYFDHLTRVYTTIAAKYVFLGAGAVGTTEVLFRSRAKDKLKPNKADAKENGLDNLGKNFYANGDNIGVVFDTEEYAAPSQGPTITTTVLHVDEAKGGKPADWFLIQDGGIPANLEPILGYFWSPRWFNRNSLTEARRRDKSWLRAPVELGDRLVADFELAAGDLASVLTSERQRVMATRLGFPTEWINFLPPSARTLGEQLKNSSEMAIAELRRFDARLLEKLARDTWYLSKLVLDRDRLVARIADVIAEFYPPVRNVLRKGRGFENLIGVLKFAVLGKPPSQRTMVLLAMGPDLAGTLMFGDRGRLRIQWKDDDSPSAKLFASQERLMRDFAVELGGELRTNPEWTFGRRAVTVHAQGGCGMKVRNEDEAVTEQNGEVIGFNNLYVVDAAAFPSSVGANPSCTIAAVAERKAEMFIEKLRGCKTQQVTLTQKELESLETRRLSTAKTASIRSEPICIAWREELRGWIADFAGRSEPRSPDELLDFERRPGFNAPRVHLALQIVLPSFDVFNHAFEHRHRLHKAIFTGRMRCDIDSCHESDVCGRVEFGTRPNPETNNCELSGMTYSVFRKEKSKCDVPAVLFGTKCFENDPGYDVWSDLTTMFLSDCSKGLPSKWAGIVRVSTRDFFTIQLPSYTACSMREYKIALTQERTGEKGQETEPGRYDPSPAARVWALARFANICYRGIADEYAR